MENNTKCSKCGNKLEKGLFGDRGYMSQIAGHIQWGTEMKNWKGLINKKDVVVYRCESCGYLESYAN